MHWSTPPPPIIKINVDAAVSSATGYAAFSVVARDHHGSVMGWRRRILPGVRCPEVAETFAILGRFSFDFG